MRKQSVTVDMLVPDDMDGGGTELAVEDALVKAQDNGYLRGCDIEMISAVRRTKRGTLCDLWAAGTSA